jgi:hypothetical protein
MQSEQNIKRQNTHWDFRFPKKPNWELHFMHVERSRGLYDRGGRSEKAGTASQQSKWRENSASKTPGDNLDIALSTFSAPYDKKTFSPLTDRAGIFYIKGSGIPVSHGP